MGGGLGAYWFYLRVVCFLWGGLLGRTFKDIFVLDSVRVTHGSSVGGVARITSSVNVSRGRLRLCNGCGTGLSSSLLGELRGRGSNGLVLIATIGPAPTKRNGAAIAMKLNRTVGGVKGGTIVTLHRPSLNPMFNVGNKTTNNNCDRIIPVRRVGLRFANSVRTVADTGGLVYTVLSGDVRRKGRLSVSPHAVRIGHYLSVGSHTLHGVVYNLNKGVGKIPERSRFVVAITSRVVTVLYLTDSIFSLGGHLNGVLITCGCGNRPICYHSVGTGNSVAILLGRTVGPGLVRALRGGPTVVRNNPFTGVTRNYGSIHTAGTTLGLNSCTVARTNFNSSLNTRGFVSVGYHLTKLIPDYVILISAIHSVGCGNNITGRSLTGRGVRTLGGNSIGLNTRVRGLGGFNIPIIITVGRFCTSASTRVSCVGRFYTRTNARITIAGYFTRNNGNSIRLTRGIITTYRGRGGFGPLCPVSVPICSGVRAVTHRVCNTSNISCATTTGGDVSSFIGLNTSGVPIYVTGARCDLSSGPGLLNEPQNFEVAVASTSLSGNTNFLIYHANTMVAVPNLSGGPTTFNVSVSSSNGAIKLF